MLQDALGMEFSVAQTDVFVKGLNICNAELLLHQHLLWQLAYK